MRPVECGGEEDDDDKRRRAGKSPGGTRDSLTKGTNFKGPKENFSIFFFSFLLGAFEGISSFLFYSCLIIFIHFLVLPSVLNIMN